MSFLIDPYKSTPLCEIMGRQGSDKGHSDFAFCQIHNYTLLYHQLFEHLCDEPIRIFELGLGTHNVNIPSAMHPVYVPGGSIRGWAEYFPKAKVYGADIDHEILFEEPRIMTYFCDQTNPYVIKTLWDHKELEEPFDIIIDDGLHKFDANVCFFENSIHKIKKGGFYVIEDINPSDYILFEEKVLTWKKKYPLYEFWLFKLPSLRNQQDNNIMIILT